MRQIKKVYSLPGSLSATAIHSPENSGNKKSMLAYPNPSSNKTNIRYKLPQGVDHGEIVIYQLNGTEAKKYTVDNTFDSLVIENNELPNGTYFYSLKTKDRILETKKLMVIN